MLACIFARAFNAQAFIKGGFYFLGFLIILFLIDRLIDYLSNPKSKSL